MKIDDDQDAAHGEMFRRDGCTAEAVARALEAAERACASKPLPESPFFAAPPEDPTELLVGVVVANRKPANPDVRVIRCGHVIAIERYTKEPKASELPALLEKHASRLAEMGHYDIAADVQLAAERLSRG